MYEDESWTEITDGYAVGDVVSWYEAIWSDNTRGRGRNKKHIFIGEQRVIGQIEALAQDYIHIKVMKSELVKEEGAKPSHLHIADSILRKKPTTLAKGKVQRLLWEDEQSRVPKFI